MPNNLAQYQFTTTRNINKINILFTRLAFAKVKGNINQLGLCSGKIICAITQLKTNILIGRKEVSINDQIAVGTTADIFNKTKSSPMLKIGSTAKHNNCMTPVKIFLNVPGCASFLL